MFRFIVIVSIALLFAADSDHTPMLNWASMCYKPLWGTRLELKCKSYDRFGEDNYNLTIQKDSGNVLKSVRSQLGQWLKATATLNGIGTYKCITRDEHGMNTTLSIKFTNDRNIFVGWNRQLYLLFKIEAASSPTGYLASLSAFRQVLTDEVATCYKDEARLEMVGNEYVFEYKNINPVSGKYKCEYNGQVYGFEAELKADGAGLL